MSLAVLSLAAILLVQPQPGPQPGTAVNSLGLSATYDVQAAFDWQDRRARVDTLATVSNPMPWSTRALAFNLSTLRTGRAQLTAATVDGQPVTPTVDDQTIVVRLPQLLAPGGQALVRITYEARLNGSPRADSDEWGFARTDDLLTAYRWIPWLSRTTKFDRPSVGDPFVTSSSPRVSVTISVNRELTFATSGVESGSDSMTHTFEAVNVRDFNLAASPSFEVSSRAVGGTRIVFFHRRLPAQGVLDIAERSMIEFSERVGPYPYPQLTIAEVGPWAPLESPAHFWLPDNAPARLLPWMTAHETAHQWFYAVVGNDQAREPFADEALSDFMARDLIARFVRSQCPPGLLDSTIYDLGECYPWVVYVQGVDFLRERRERMGNATFWAAVADYYAANRFGLGGTRELLAALAGAAEEPLGPAPRFPRLRAPAFACLPLLSR